MKAASELSYLMKSIEALSLKWLNTHRHIQLVHNSWLNAWIVSSRVRDIYGHLQLYYGRTMEKENVLKIYLNNT